MLNPSNLWKAVKLSIIKLHPFYQFRNPVMFIVFIGALITTLMFSFQLYQCLPIPFLQMLPTVTSSEPCWFTLSISICLWFTVIFANFAESVAEGRGKAQADHLRGSRQDTIAKLLTNPSTPKHYQLVPADQLRINNYVLVEAGDFVPGDGQVIKGVASVDESAITGESSPVIRENGGDRDSVTGGTRIISDWLIIQITSNPGEMFIDKMIALVEGAQRQKTPNEIALGILLAAMSLLFLVVVTTLYPISVFSITEAHKGSVVGITVLISLLVCLIPTTIGGLLSAIGIAGLNRLMAKNIIAMSGRAVESAGDVSTLLLDKTGTITLGNRQAVALIPTENIELKDLFEAAYLSSLADETPEGKSIITLVNNLSTNSTFDQQYKNVLNQAEFIPFTAETRMSGVTLNGQRILKGAKDAIEKYLKDFNESIPLSLHGEYERIASGGGTPLFIIGGPIDAPKTLGLIHLKDIIKVGIKERLASLRQMGIKSIMITGDNHLTASAIAAEVGVDDYLAESAPEDKLRLIRERQCAGELVAMVGDGTNDAPALAQSDVAVCMNNGTQAAKEAANMIDLDSDPTKLIEVVEIGKQLLMTRGALTTFSIANDIAKYFVIIPAAFISTFPQLAIFNVMGFDSPYRAILSAVIFNALIIVFLIPLALRGIPYRPMAANLLLRRHIFIYGLGGILVPFVGIKLIDFILMLISEI